MQISSVMLVKIQMKMAAVTAKTCTQLNKAKRNNPIPIHANGLGCGLVKNL
ncbi:hypothetical protein FM038_25385 [Shewanella eurypsychrophilus]|uniref:Uncharacterized protein n=1 Tax=Shewanella eurypsychrophilus TaxID=2593656 RepID=A0ABX8S3A1_9GAMM|nr:MULTISPECIES: hypothetical protein [Shewanella]QXP44998.1 hypothetical protein FM038_25385 [Shewanella eurypsychrophilus]